VISLMATLSRSAADRGNPDRKC